MIYHKSGLSLTTNWGINYHWLLQHLNQPSSHHFPVVLHSIVAFKWSLFQLFSSLESSTVMLHTDSDPSISTLWQFLSLSLSPRLNFLKYSKCQDACPMDKYEILFSFWRCQTACRSYMPDPYCKVCAMNAFLWELCSSIIIEKISKNLFSAVTGEKLVFFRDFVAN